MKILYNVKSNTRPVEIDDNSSSTTVFVREDIKEVIEEDPVFKTSKTVYVYTEKQYTFPEWNKIITDGIKEQGVIVQEQIDITQLALAEMMEFLTPVIEINMINTISKYVKQHSGIALMYSGMIKRHLITIDRVPDYFKDEVLECLNDK